MTLKIDNTQFWESNYNKHPALTNDMITVAEKLLNVELPSALIELLRIQNGGYTKGFGFPMTQKTTWSKNHVPLESLCGIVTDTSIKTAHNLLKTMYMTKEWGLPERQVLLTGEGDWWITLDYRNHPLPSIRWIDVDCNEDIHVADSFENFINGLKPLGDFTS